MLPLSKKLAEPARELARELRRGMSVFYDDAGNIGRRYRRQDEAGTPYLRHLRLRVADGWPCDDPRARFDEAGAHRAWATYARHLRERVEFGA